MISKRKDGGILIESSFTLYKLIILYMLQKVNFPLTNAQISDFILDRGYTNYFHLQQAISEMLDTHLIEVRPSGILPITR